MFTYIEDCKLAPKGTEDKRKEIIQEAKERFDACSNYYSEDYQRGQQDADFALGQQWDARIKSSREKENRPCLTENRMLPFVNNVINEVRQARPSIIVKPVDDKGDVKIAEVLRGIIRNIEKTSRAETCYDSAVKNSVMSGLGWLRVGTRYCGYDSFDQEAYIDRIVNFQSVFIDPNATELDGSDAEYGFVYSDMEKEEFKRNYPEEDIDQLSGSSWYDGTNVRIAEYFYKDYKKKTLIEYQVDGFPKKTGYKEDMTEETLELVEIIRERETQVCTVRYCKMAGDCVLEEGEFPGQYIPLVPVYGFEAYVDNQSRFFSLIYPAKDSQRMLNYWKTAATEIVALQPKAPYIGAKGQFKSYSKQWAAANIENFPFLEYDMVSDPETGALAPPPQRQAPPTSSGSIMQEAMSSAEAIKASLGMYDASIGNQTNDISGLAVGRRQRQGDTNNYHFVDNLSVAISQVGRILVDIIPIVYSGERVVRILGEDGKEDMVALNQAVRKEGNSYIADDSGDQVMRLDLGKYDVAVEVGNSFATRREEGLAALMELSKNDPRVAEVGADLMFKIADFPYSDELADRMRAVMPPAVLGDSPEAERLKAVETQLQQTNEKLALTEQALQTKEQNEELKNQIDLMKVQNDTLDSQSNAAKVQAEIQKMAAETQGINVDVITDLAAAVTDMNQRLADVEDAADGLLTMKEEEVTGAPEEPAT